MKLGTEVAFDPGHIVLDGDQPPPTKKGAHPQFLAHVRCGETAEWIQDAIWYGGRPRPRPDCVRQGPSSAAPPPQKGAQHCDSSPALFGPCLLWPNGRPSPQLLSSCRPL